MNNFENINYPVPKQKYKVLVRCTTYNQSEYIEDALNGFVMQHTNFPFVCFVMDDASTDGEQEVIKAWMVRECDMSKAEIIDIPTSIIIIVPHKTNTSCTFAFYLLKQNLYGTGKKKKYLDPWREKCEYEAMCEGDDYWIDASKLQKQVDFLETHEDYSMCFHEAEILNETNISFKYPKLENREYSSNELFNEWIVPTASMLIKSEALIKMTSDKRILNGDINIVLATASIGKVYGMHETMSVYRVQENGLTINRTKKDVLALQMRYIDHFKCLSETYKKVETKFYNLKIADTYINIAFIYARRNNYILFISNIYQSIKYSGLRIFSRILNKIIK